jgi:hypothetical protein
MIWELDHVFFAISDAGLARSAAPRAALLERAASAEGGPNAFPKASGILPRCAS